MVFGHLNAMPSLSLHLKAEVHSARPTCVMSFLHFTLKQDPVNSINLYFMSHFEPKAPLETLRM